MDDRTRLEIAEIFETVLEAKMQELYTQIALGIVEMLNQFEGIMTSDARASALRSLAEHQLRERSQAERDANRMSELMLEGLRK